MSELRVPTVALAAEVLCADGRAFAGRIFLPASASRHSGPMRPEEWMNETPSFFPFLPDDGDAPVILNKQEIVVLSVEAMVDEEPPAEGVQVLERSVCVECQERRLEGVVRIEMPKNQSRVLDHLNRGEPFLTLREGQRHHLIRKQRITRVYETRES
jgi:hypothetical protein